MRRTGAIVLGLGFVFCISMLLAGYAIYERFEQTNERREAQAAFNARVTQLSLDYCMEIEKLKTARREGAQSAYDSRHEDFQLLGLTLTPALEERLAMNLAVTLARFKAEPCPRPPRDRQ